MATLVYGAVGAGLGAALGSVVPGIGTSVGAKWGWSIGTLVGNYIDTPRPELGLLADRHVSASSYGAVVPMGWGRNRYGGNVTWVQSDSTGNQLIKHQYPAGGGKGGGGGGAEIDHYWVTLQVAFMVGTIYLRDAASPLGGTLVPLGCNLVRLYANDVLVYEAGRTDLQCVLNTNLWFHAGTETGNQDSIIATAEGSDVTSNPGIANIVIENFDTYRYGNGIPQFIAVIETNDYALSDVVTHICGCVGLQSSDLDVSQGTGVAIKNGASGIYRGVTISDQEAPRDTFDSLLGPLQFDFPEVDGVLRLVARGGSSVATIDAGELGASSSGDRVARIPRDQAQTLDLPGRVEVNYFNTDADCLQDMAPDQRQGATINNVQSLTVPLAMDSDSARAMARQINDVAWNDAETYAIQLPPPYLWLAPGDPITVPLEDGSLVRTRITEYGAAPLGEIKLTLAKDLGLAPVLASSVARTVVAGGGVRPVATSVVVATAFAVWSGKELRDSDMGTPGFYLATSGGPGWPGATCWYSLDGGTSWIQGPSSALRSTFGVASSSAGLLNLWGCYNVTLQNVNLIGYKSGALQLCFCRHFSIKNCGLNSLGLVGGTQQTAYGYQFDGCWDGTVDHFANYNATTQTESVFIIHNGSGNVAVTNSYGCFCDAHGQASNGFSFTNCNALGANVGNPQWSLGDSNYTFANCNCSPSNATYAGTVGNDYLYPYILSIENGSANVTATNCDWGGLVYANATRSGYVRFPAGVLTGTFTIGVNGVTLPKTGCPSGLGATGYYTVGSGGTKFGSVNADVQWELNGESASGAGSVGAAAYDPSGPAAVSAGDTLGVGAGASGSSCDDIVFNFTEGLAASPPTITCASVSGLSGIAYVSSPVSRPISGVTLSGNRIMNNVVGSYGQKTTIQVYNSTAGDRNSASGAALNTDGGAIGTFSLSGFTIANLYAGSTFNNIVGAGSATKGAPMTGTLVFNNCAFQWEHTVDPDLGLTFQSAWDGNLAVAFNSCTTNRTVTSSTYHTAGGVPYTGAYGPATPTTMTMTATGCTSNWTGISGTPTFISTANSGAHGFTAPTESGTAVSTSPAILTLIMPDQRDLIADICGR